MKQPASTQKPRTTTQPHFDTLAASAEGRRTPKDCKETASLNHCTDTRLRLLNLYGLERDWFETFRAVVDASRRAQSSADGRPRRIQALTFRCPACATPRAKRTPTRRLPQPAEHAWRSQPSAGLCPQACTRSGRPKTDSPSPPLDCTLNLRLGLPSCYLGVLA